MGVHAGISRPYLAWAVQDFHLELAALGGTNKDNWIEKVLSDIDHSNNGTSHMKEQFRSFFAGYNAYTLSFPVKNTDDLQRLSRLGRANMTSEYLAGMPSSRTMRVSHYACLYACVPFVARHCELGTRGNHTRDAREHSMQCQQHPSMQCSRVWHNMWLPASTPSRIPLCSFPPEYSARNKSTEIHELRQVSNA